MIISAFEYRILFHINVNLGSYPDPKKLFISIKKPPIIIIFIIDGSINIKQIVLRYNKIDD